MNVSGKLLRLALGLVMSSSLLISMASDSRKESKAGFAEPDRGWVRKTLKNMTLRDKVAQLVKIRVPGRFLNRRSQEFLDIEEQIRRNHVGGVVLFAGNIYESAVLLNELQQMSPLPLIVAADFERGAAFRITDTTSFPWTMAIGATGSEDFAYQEGVITAREARALGVHWVYAPVMDVNNNPDNPVINIRSYGEDPQLVARLGAAFIRGCRDNGVLTTAKHFPGHGDTATDSHIGLAVAPADRARLDTMELVPFRSAVQSGVDSIMTAHVAVPRVTGEPEVPATLSSKILTDLLRNTLQFQGLLVTDALEMGGITTRYWSGQAAIKALQAGNDMLLLPPEPDVAINEVVRAVQRGDLTEARIDRSVEKILLTKTRLGLHAQRMVSLDRIDAVVAAPENQRLAQLMADRSVTLVKDEKRLLPVNPLHPPKIFSLVLAADLDPSPGALFQTELRRRFPSAMTAAVDPRTPPELVATIAARAAEADLIICSTLIRVISSKGNVALPESQRAILEKLLALGKPVIWVAFGNPYVLRLYPQVPAYLCTFSYSDVSQIAAARALSGEIAITGKMPVSIPEHSRVGEGLQVPKLDMTLKIATPEALGLPKDAFQEVERLLAAYVEKKAFPGAALAVGYRGSLVLDFGAGRLDFTEKSNRANGDTVYDLASLSKVVGTASAAMVLYESGRLLLDAPVQDYLPEFQGINKDRVRVQHLLLHSAGLPAYMPLYKEARGYEEVVKRVYAVPLEYEPGSRIQYSDLGMILLGEILSRAAARSLDAFLAEKLFVPLGMKSTTYNPPKNLISHIAPTENDPWRKRVVRAEVHDENAYAMGGVAGHAGLFSSAHDLAVFAQLMLNRGMYDHDRYLRPETIARFTSVQNAQNGGECSLGWMKPSASNWTGKLFSGVAFGHTGFTGTSIWIDPDRQLFLILLTNRVHPTRENTMIDEVRRVIAEAVVRAIDGSRASSED